MEERERTWIYESSLLDLPTSDSPSIIVAHHHHHCVLWDLLIQAQSIARVKERGCGDPFSLLTFPLDLLFPLLKKNLLFPAVFFLPFFFQNHRPAAHSRLARLIGRLSPPNHLTAYHADFLVNLGAEPTPSA